MNQGPQSAEFPSPMEFTPLRAVLWMLGAFSVMVVLALALMIASPESKSDLVALGMVSSAAFVMVSAFLIGRYPAGPRLGHAVGLKHCHPLALLMGFCIGLCAQVPADLLQSAVDRLWPASADEVSARAQMLSGASGAHALALALVIGALVPFAEEIFFRGAVYGALRRGKASEWRAAGVAGLGFALCHFNARLLLPLIFVAFVLGVLRSFSGSLWPAILAHVGFNSVAVAGGGGHFEFLDHISGLHQGLVTSLLVLLLLAYARWVGGMKESQQFRAEEERVHWISLRTGGAKDDF